MCVKRKEVLVLDIDDTLYLERDYVKSGFRAVGTWIDERFGKLGFEEICDGLFNDGARGVVFNLALKQAGLPDDSELVHELVEVYRHHQPEIELLGDAREAIREFHGQLPLAVISDGPLVAQQQKVHALSLENWCEPILLTDSWGHRFWKPHARAFREVEQYFDVSGEVCVYVGDNPRKDFSAPRELGWTTVRIRRKRGLHAHADTGVREASHFEITELTELRRLAECGESLGH